MPFLDKVMLSSLGDFEATNRLIPLILLCVGSLCVIVGIAIHIVACFDTPRFSISHGESSEIETAASDINSDDDQAHSDRATLAIHVSGEVVSPGVYHLDEGSRVYDAIVAAGGFNPCADGDSLNQARSLKDGEQLRITSKEHERPEDGAVLSSTSDSQLQTLSETKGTANSSTSLVNINTASIEQLDVLPGVGASTAQKIVTHREKEGPFLQKEDLKRVPGIGDRKYASLEGSICV